MSEGHELVDPRFDAAFDALGVGVLVFDTDAHIAFANQHARTVLDFAPEGAGAVESSTVEYIDSDGAPLTRESLPVAVTLREGTPQGPCLIGARRPGNPTTWYLTSSVPLGEDGGAPGQGAVCTFIDLTAQRATETAWRESEERFRLLAENAADVIYRVALGPEPHVEYVNPALRSLLGIEPSEWYADLRLVIDVTEAGDIPPEVLREGSIDRPMQVLARMRHRDGRVVWVEHHLVPVHGADGATVAVEGIARDVSARKALEEDLSRQALHDALTGLPNRSLLLDRLQHALGSLERGPGVLGVLYLDLDRFKTVNDNLGHEAGDRLLVAIARRLEHAMRPSDSVARLGGDEFAAVLVGLGSRREAGMVAARILADVAQPVDLVGGELVTTASIGVVTATEPDASPAELLRRADVAMYRAKDLGRARTEWYEEPPDSRSPVRPSD
jgi:diguanylate cyclase (GGDEF)-like protein/PAS domain S-box-containing protein